MATLDADLPLDRAAALHDGLAHPTRVAVLRALRERRRLALADLRRAVAPLAGRDVDTRTLQHHLHTMQRAGIVDVRLVEGREEVTLVLDVALRLRPVPPP